jgi:hypothetical protein
MKDTESTPLLFFFFGTFRARLQEVTDIAAKDCHKRARNSLQKRRSKMEKPTEAEALRIEYLELMKTFYDTCLTGLNKAKAHMAGTLLGMLVTQSALLGALLFLEGNGVVVILVAVGALTYWWFRRSRKEWAKHKEMKGVYEKLEMRKTSIERKYFDLTGVDIQQTFTEAEVYEAFDELMKKYPSYQKKPNTRLMV